MKNEAYMIDLRILVKEILSPGTQSLSLLLVKEDDDRHVC